MNLKRLNIQSAHKYHNRVHNKTHLLMRLCAENRFGAEDFAIHERIHGTSYCRIQFGKKWHSSAKFDEIYVNNIQLNIETFLRKYSRDSCRLSL